MIKQSKMEYQEEEVTVNSNTIDEWKLALQKFLKDSVDKFEVNDWAWKCGLQIQEKESFSNLKYRVQQFLLWQLLKSDKEKASYYERLLAETEKRLDLKKGKPFLCFLVGCLFSTNHHRSYLNHLKSVHYSQEQLVCNFKKQCVRQFSSLQLLLNHVKESHSVSSGGLNPEKPVKEDVECRCDLLSCGGRKFKNTKLLLTHINNCHLEEERSCVFEECKARFSRGSTSRHHFRIKHTSIGNVKLKPENLVVPETVWENFNDEQVSDEYSTDADLDEFYHGENDASLFDIDSLHTDGEANDEGEDGTEHDHYFQMQYADFLNRLCNVSFIPAKKVTEIANSFLLSALKSKEIRRSKVKKSLDAIPSLTESEKERILKDTIDDDDYIKAQKELSSEFKRNQFIRRHFKYVAPVQITLNKNEIHLGKAPDVFHYVPIKESFKQLIEDESLNDALKIESEKAVHQDNVVRDLKDGEAFKTNPFFVENPGSYAALFYSDAVELSNPLGWAKGRHKIVQVFYTLCQIPRSQRSQIDRTQVCMIFKESLIKKYGYESIFRLLVKDLKDLEVGINVSYPVERLVQLGVLAYSADNLEAHQLGGFSCCFSSSDICRFCHCKHSDLIENIHDFDGDDMKEYWTIKDYDKICSKLEDEGDPGEEFELVVADGESIEVDDEGDIEDQVAQEGEKESSDDEQSGDEGGNTGGTFGLRQRCPLNQLQSFHAVTSFPPDCMHDLLEGVVAQDLCGGIKILCDKGWFSLEEYNQKLKSFKFTSYETNDKPQELGKKNKKLPGKACSLWVHIRNFPLIVKDSIVDPSDEVLALMILLGDITARVTAFEFRTHEIDNLEQKIIKYLDDRKAVFEAHPAQMGTPKPKHHFLSHYGQSVRLFGPPLSYWTGRFESKHRYLI